MEIGEVGQGEVGNRWRGSPQMKERKEGCKESGRHRTVLVGKQEVTNRKLREFLSTSL